MKFVTRKISYKDIELLRNWRNKDYVKSQMLSSNIISSHEQEKWFKGLNFLNNHCFIYSFDHVDVGYMSCKIKDPQKKIFDVGVYCGNEQFKGHPINFLSILFIHDYSFKNLELERSLTLIKKDNKSSKNINQKIGYKYSASYNKLFDEYSLDKNEYEIKSKPLRKIVKRLS